jgi:uncharacterized protein (UPF0332 family)/predicted nucleotidyltransferase
VPVALSTTQQQALQRFAKALGDALPQDVLEVRLFGSRARGDAKPWSDVDLLVVARDAASAERIRQATASLRLSCWSDEFPGLTCVVLEEADFRRHQATHSLLYRDVRDQGVPLWSSSTDLWNEEGVGPMNREWDVLFHLDQAERALQSAKRDLAAQEAGGAASRAYYAAFHAASAALLTENIERAKHSDLIAEFDRLTRQNRLLGRSFHNKLRPLYELRQTADYGNTYVKDNDARRAVEQAESFVGAAKDFCRVWLSRQRHPEHRRDRGIDR